MRFLLFIFVDAEAEEKSADDSFPDSLISSPSPTPNISIKAKIPRSEMKRSITPPDGLMSSLGLSSFLRYNTFTITLRETKIKY